jgi:lipocalin
VKIYKGGLHRIFMDENNDVFLKIDLENYRGKWVVICEADIVSFGDNAKEVYEDALKKRKGKKLMIAKVPEEQTMIY